MYNILYLTEAGKKVGWGHIKRAQAICELLYEYRFTVLLEAEKSEIEHVAGVTWQSKNLKWEILSSYDVIIFDSFCGTPEIYKTLEYHNCVIYIDDYLRAPVKRGMVIDWTPGVFTERYFPKEESVKKYFGLEYLVTRKLFHQKIKKNQYNNKIQKLTFTFGGSDSLNLTKELVSFIISDRYEIKILGTSLYPSYNTYRNDPRFKWDLDDKKYASVLRNSDLVITTGGQILYELASIGMPAIAIYAIKNQDEDIAGLTLTGTCIPIHRNNLKEIMKLIDDIDQQKLLRMRKAMQSISGKGEKLKREMIAYINECIFV